MTDPVDRPTIVLRYWLVTAAVVAVSFAALEATLRAGLVWRLPLGIVKAADNDRHLEAAWETHQPPSGEDTVLVLGSSNTRVVTELPDNGLARALRTHTGRPVSVLSLCLSRASLDEYVVLLEAALEQGHRPEVVLVGVWPGQLGLREYDPLLAERMPLSSTLLLADAPPVHDPDSLWARYGPRFVAVERFQNAANAWMRRRFHDLLRQRFRWVVAGRDAPDPQQHVPFQRDHRRLEMIHHISEELKANRPDLSRLQTVVRMARGAGSRVLVVEAPRSSPVRRAFTAFASRYRAQLTWFARDEGAEYLDPNQWLALQDDEFADMFHVTPEGQQRYAAAIVPRLAALLR